MQPYIAPFQYAYVKDIRYLHFTDYGKKKSFFQTRSPSVHRDRTIYSNLSECEFVVLTGKLIGGESRGRKGVIEKMAEGDKQELSENFLLIHGFSQALIGPIFLWTNRF